MIDTQDPEKNLVRDLGVLAATVSPEMAKMLGDLRIDSGVVVIARTSDTWGIDLAAADLIHAANNSPITSIEGLRKTLAQFHRGDSIVLEVERDGGLLFIAFEKD